MLCSSWWGPAELHGLDDLCQELPGGADKGLPLLILLMARSFANKYQPCPGISGTEHNMFATGRQPAAAAGLAALRVA